MKRLVPTVVPAVPAAEPAGGTLVFPSAEAQSDGRIRNGGNASRANGGRSAAQEAKRSQRSAARHAEDMTDMPQQYKEVSKKVKQWRIAVGNESGGIGNDPTMYERDHRMAEMADQIEELQHLFRNHESRMASFRKQQEDRWEDMAERIDLMAESIFRLEQDKDKVRGPNAIALSRTDISPAEQDAYSRHLGSLPKTQRQIQEEQQMEKIKFEPVQDELRDSDSEDSLEPHAKATVAWENLEQRRMDHEAKLEKRKNELFEDDWQWKSNAENAFGAFIQKGMQDGLPKAMAQCGVMVFLSWIVQFVITYELLRALPDLNTPEAFGHCANPSSLQLASLGVWILMMFNNVSQMIRAALICLYADEERVGEATNETLRSLPERLFIFFFAVLSEMAMWGFLLYTGVMFILTAESPVLIVRSTVAITFIQNIDETIYAACATDNIKSQVSGTKYKIKYNKVWCGLKLRTIFDIEWFYSLYIHLLVLTGLAFGVSFLSRTLKDIKCEKLWESGIENAEVLAAND